MRVKAMATRVGVTYRFEDKAQPYLNALRAAGLDPVSLVPGQSASLAGLDGLCLSGGTDIAPSRYGARVHPETEDPDTERDALESALLEQALARDLPVLAICRGAQLLNVVLGGTLVQHLETVDKHRAAHTVAIEGGTLLASAIGAGRKEVNSRHHQAVDAVGRGLTVAARADDGVVEAIEFRGRRFVLGVQWHPEDRINHDPRDLDLFRALAAAAHAR
jgi:gamma-glutamyl-gamma-aminobutyrate hydrolase PuuD